MASIRARVSAAGLAWLALSGCHSWQPTPLSPREVIDSGGHSAVRLVGEDGSRVLARRPAIAGDFVNGLMRTCQPAAADGSRTRTCTDTVAPLLPLADVQSVEVSVLSPTRTGSLLGGLVGALGVYAHVSGEGTCDGTGEMQGSEWCVVYSLVGAAVGSLAGALVGWVAGEVGREMACEPGEACQPRTSRSGVRR